MSLERPLQVVTIFLTAFACTAVAFGAGSGDDWSQFRGPVSAGHASGGVLPAEDYGLALVWRRELGSGYSNISLANGVAVTLFSAGEVDLVAAFDAGTGDELWRTPLGNKYAGHDGSDDGPLSTPAIAGDQVFALGPLGRLVALKLADGSEIWSRTLDEESSTAPFYGYTASPLVSGDLVILTTGGEGHAITAFDRATGETRWTAGSDSVQYQTPSLVELDGKPVLVAVTDHLLHGLDPATGALRFELRHTEGDGSEGSAHVVPIDGQQFVVRYDDGAALYRSAGSGPEGIVEVWRSNAFGNSLSIPVRHGDHLYGFTGRFLTCAAIDSGEIVWRSRPPGGRGLSLIGDALAVTAPSGELVLIEASPAEYREITRVQALDRGDYATPSFAEGVFFVRNLEQMAAVRVDTSARPQIAESDPTKNLQGNFREWVQGVLVLPEAERQAAVDVRFAGVETSPLFEGGDESGLVHFYWRGVAKDVGLEGGEVTTNADGTPAADTGLLAVPGTDLFVRSADLDPKAQYTYGLSIDYADAIPDPRNPYTVDNGFNVVSELRMPQWPASPHLDPPAMDAPRGQLDTFPFRSEILGNTRQIQVWRPAGYGSDPERRYPLLVVNHGDNLLRGGLMRNTLDNLVGASVAPVIAVFVPRTAGPEYGGARVDDYVRFLVEELLPHFDRHYLTDPKNRAIMGPGSAGVTAVYTALRHPELFQRAAAQSFYPIEPAQSRFAELIAGSDPGPRLVYLVWSRHDYDFAEPSAAEATQALATMLRDAGFTVEEQIADYTPGWGGWRGQHDEILEALFPIAVSLDP